MSKPSQKPVAPTTNILIMHGDKGGVGKSFVAQALANFLIDQKREIAIIDTDTRNPDVSRMFEGVVPCAQANVRTEAGWMDVMDFVIANEGRTILINTPAGIGEYMQEDMELFARFLKKQEIKVSMELWWTMNVQHDSVNLLNEAIKAYGEHFERTRVVCNLHFADGNKSHNGPFVLWNESTLRTKIEKAGGQTLYFPGLNVRVVSKLFAPGNIMPFSEAADVAIGEKIAFGGSERFKLALWIEDVESVFAPAVGCEIKKSAPEGEVAA